jgi:hypothetical protein
MNISLYRFTGEFKIGPLEDENTLLRRISADLMLDSERPAIPLLEGGGISGNDGVHQTREVDTMTKAKTKTRWRHSAELKQQILAECAQTGASVASVSLSHGINAT